MNLLLTKFIDKILKVCHKPTGVILNFFSNHIATIADESILYGEMGIFNNPITFQYIHSTISYTKKMIDWHCSLLKKTIL